MTILRLTAIALLLVPATVQADPAPAGGATVTVVLSGLRNTRGVIQACLTARAATCPECDKDPQALRATVPAHDGVGPVFRHVAPGTYAVSLFHDANANGRLDKTLGIPNEGFGFSRDAPVQFGPPKFDAAKVVVGTGDVTLPIKLRYIL